MTIATAQVKLAGVGIVGVIAVIVAVVFGLRGCQSDQGPKIDPVTQRLIDSLKMTKRSFDSTQHAVAQAVGRDTVISIVHDRASAVQLAAAKAAASRADSLAIVARTSADSATAWHRAYDARTEEAGKLQNALAQKDSALTSERSAFFQLSGAYDRDTLRRIAIEKVNDGLKDDIAKLQQPCRIVGPIPCPSRTAVALLAGVGGALAGYGAHRP
jgi:hypothetical protein